MDGAALSWAIAERACRRRKHRCEGESRQGTANRREVSGRRRRRRKQSIGDGTRELEGKRRGRTIRTEGGKQSEQSTAAAEGGRNEHHGTD